MYETAIRPYTAIEDLETWKKTETDKWTGKSKAGRLRREKVLARFAPTNRKLKEELHSAAKEATAAKTMTFEERLEMYEFNYEASTVTNAKGLAELCYIPRKKATASSATAKTSTKKSKASLAKTNSQAGTKKRKLEASDGLSCRPKTASTLANASPRLSTAAGSPALEASSSNSEAKPRKSLADMLSFDVTSAFPAYQSDAGVVSAEGEKPAEEEEEEEVTTKKRKIEAKEKPRDDSSSVEISKLSSPTDSSSKLSQSKALSMEPIIIDAEDDGIDDDDDDKNSRTSSVESRRPPSLKPTSPDRESVSSRGGGGVGGVGVSGEGRKNYDRGRSLTDGRPSAREPLTINVRGSSASHDEDDDDDFSDDINDFFDSDAYSDAGALSPTTENDLFRQFCLCHFTEMNVKLPWLNRVEVKAMLKDHWRTLGADERMWYVYNFLTPEHMAPGVAAPRPANPYLETVVKKGWSRGVVFKNVARKCSRMNEARSRLKSIPKKGVADTVSGSRVNGNCKDGNATSSEEANAKVATPKVASSKILNPMMASSKTTSLRAKPNLDNVIWEIEKLSSISESQTKG